MHGTSTMTEPSTAQQKVRRLPIQTAGNYTVNLTVTNADGKDSEIKTNYIRVTIPVSNILADSTIHCQHHAGNVPSDRPVYR